MNRKEESMRIAYGHALEALAEEFPFAVMDADLSKATQTCRFAESYPNRFFNMGICEANMMAAAAGFASCGSTVIASTFAVFAAGRAYEPIRQMIGHTGLNVKICATHAGVLIGPDGATHQAMEDIALMRVIPGMTVLSPSDAQSVKPLLALALRRRGPVYMRLARLATPAVYDDALRPAFQAGGSSLLRTGGDAALLATGHMVPVALEAAEKLATCGIQAAVVDMYSIKPIDVERILRCACETGRIITLEDHSVIGGLGSAVSEVLCENRPVPLKRIGIPDVFGTSGNVQELADYFNLHADAVKKTVMDFCAKHI